MSIARKALIGFLSFLLFLSLSGIGLCYTAGRTALQPEFVISRLENLDVTVLAKDIVKAQVPSQIASIASQEYMDYVIDEVVVDLEPWIRGQTADAVNEGYDYILGESEELLITVDLGEAKPVVRESLWRIISQSAPSWMSILPQSELESVFNTVYDDLSAGLPDTLEIDEATVDSIDPEIMPLLDRARQYVGYYRIAYGVFIGVTAALIAGIIGLNRRRVKGSTLWLGIPCVVCGAFAFLGGYVVARLADQLILRIDIPSQLQDWFGGLIMDSAAPLTTYGIAVMIGGASLLITCAIYGRRRLDEGM